MDINKRLVFFFGMVVWSTKPSCQYTFFPSHLSSPPLRPPPSLSCSACPTQSHLSLIGWICCFSQMNRAPIGCVCTFVTRLKGDFTGGFFLSATHVDQAANGTCTADQRTVNYSLSTSLGVSSPSLLPKTNFSAWGNYDMRRAVTLFTSCNGLLLFRRQNSTKAATVKREQSSGNTIWQLHLLVAREYPSPSPHRGPVSRGTGGRARACPHFTCTFWDCWSRLFTYLRLKSLTLQPLYTHETNEVGVGWSRSCFALWYVQMSVFFRAFLSLLSPLCIRNAFCSWCLCSFNDSVICDSPWFSCDIISCLIPLDTYLPPQ